MKARLPFLVLLFGSSLLAAGASLSPDLDQHCPAITTISGDEEWAKFTTEQYEYGWRKTFYLHPDPGFKGVWLEAAGNGLKHDAWFTLDNNCFPQRAQWWRLWAGIYKQRKSDNNNDYYHVFEVRTGHCYLQCRRGSFPGVWNVYVMAHGPSRWRLQKPPLPCTEVGYTEQWSSLINCTTISTTNTTTPTTTTITPTTTTITPTTTTPTTTTPTTIITITVVPVMIGVAVFFLLVVVTRRLRQRTVFQEDVRMRFQGALSTGESEVVENSLYETLDNTRRTEVVENSLYEPLDNVRKPR